MSNLTNLNLRLKNEADGELVFGEGNERARVLLVGEAPGKDEVALGRPFVGKAGKNLSEFLEILGLRREDIYITNTVKIRPTKRSPKTGKEINRPPSAEETAFFRPYLMREIELVSPEVVVTLGNVPLRAVLGDDKALIGELHGREVAAGRLKVFPLYHPAAVIYNRSLRETYLEDLLELKRYLERK